MQNPSNNKQKSPQKHRFRGGVTIDSEKGASAEHGMLRLKNVPFIDLPVSASEEGFLPCVKAGDRVLMGETVAVNRETGERLTASLSGTVTLCDTLIDGASAVPAVRVENDFQWEAIDVKPLKRDLWTAEGLLERLERCNVRCGSLLLTKILERGSGTSHIVVRALEAAPYVSSDRRAALDMAKNVVQGMEILHFLLPKTRTVLVVDKNDAEIIALYEKLFAEQKDFCVFPIKNRYPNGDRRVLAAVFSGRKPGSPLAERGAVVIDAYTAAAAARAVLRGEPDTRRVVSVAGDAVVSPENILAPIGVQLSTLAAACGGYSVQPRKILTGDPLTGTALYSDSVPTTADTAAFMAFSEDADAASCECINCGRCAKVCPAGLLPVYIYKSVLSERGDINREFRLDECILCAACDYVCPSRLPLSNTFARLKSKKRGDLNG